ncbi:YibE/F family protein [Mesotoga sp. UBA6090]|uniref:YibE/F family protein n=1 Tax=Mesotoga sp. UBA6090 TaxID=1946860 RepID=UPI0025FFDD44|nr:YibE/F family protein [Mesotoga sp. UBA6090]
MRLKRALLYIMGAVLFGYVLFTFINASVNDQSTIKGKVLEIVSFDETGGYSGKGLQTLRIKILNGSHAGEEVIVENHFTDNTAMDIRVEDGDTVVLYVDQRGEETFHVTDFIRQRYVFVIVLVFITLLLLIGKISGLKSFITLTITGLIIIKVMLPLILNGFDPIGASSLSAVLITVLTFGIVSGLNTKSFSAAFGTLCGVLSASVIAYVTGSLANLTGLSSDEATMLVYIPQNIHFDFMGLLFAGIIIGTLGAVMDVAMSISSAMYEMKSLNPDITPGKLVKSGFNIGRDIMGTMTNTLILAYTGSSIFLMLVFLAYKTPLIRIINMDVIATEIIRAFAGSIGIILSIPATVFLSAFLLNKYRSRKT